MIPPFTTDCHCENVVLLRDHPLIVEKLIGKAIANALCLVDDDVEGAEETTMVKRWRGF